MSNGTQQLTPPPPAPGFDEASQVTDVKPDLKEKLAPFFKSGVDGGAMDAMLAKHHQQRLDEARMHKRNAVTASSAVATVRQGINPETFQRFDDPNYKGPTQQELEQRYLNEYNTNWGLFEKSAGVNKQAKGALAKAKMIVEHLMGKAGGQSGQPSSQGQLQGRPGGATPPPAAPGASATREPGAETTLPMLRQSMEEQHEFGKWKRQQDLLKQYKIDEETAKQKAIADAKAANPTGRPVMGPATSVRNAKVLAAQGKQFMDADGNPIDLTDLPDNMGLKFIAWGGKHYYEPFSPNQRAITVGKETYAISPMDISAIGEGAGVDIGPHDTPSTTATTDPTTGQTTITKRTPTITGAKGRAGGLTQPPAATGTTAPAAAAPAGPTAHQKVSPDAATPPLDKDGHIASDWHGAAPQVIEGANQLHDGMDLKDIGGTTKTKPLSEALARKTWGWSRDKFTPLEKQQIALASRYIKEAAASPALKSLDDDFISQLPMIGATGDTAKEGNIGKALTKLSAMSTTPEQREFLRLYRQMAGTISGLGRLSRGGRITEATVNRLLSELPNPTNTANAADAVARLQRLQDEIDTALSHDSFEELASGRVRKEPAARKGGLTPPPKAGAAAKSSGVIHWTRDAQGNPTPAPASP